MSSTSTNNYFRVMIAQFHSGMGARGPRPYQWHIIIEVGYDGRYVLGKPFYVRGSEAQHFSLFTAQDPVRYKRADAYRGAVCIGAIHRSYFDSACARIMEVEAVNHGALTSQVWAYAAMRKLHALGFLREPLWSDEFLRRSLSQAEAAWERGDD
ncbi:hypothetical protein C8Q79DRAFT_248818 [Trametes meyenii]|nr:hypothetical protein C8Q79DRAFT_248818 [Trametes meyenii]